MPETISFFTPISQISETYLVQWKNYWSRRKKKNNIYRHLGTLHILIYLISTLWIRYYYLYFTDEEMGACKGQITCWSCPSLWEARFESRWTRSQNSLSASYSMLFPQSEDLGTLPGLLLSLLSEAVSSLIKKAGKKRCGLWVGMWIQMFFITDWFEPQIRPLCLQKSTLKTMKRYPRMKISKG